MAAMFSVNSDFIGNYKLGDNINHNLRLLSLLYNYYELSHANDQQLLRKPIIILLVSITEAVLHDFHYRIQSFTLEGVRNLADTVADYIRGKHLDELEKYIASARKHDLFDIRDPRFYDRLDELRLLRNRIHIQNTKCAFEANDCNAFNEQRKILAEMVLEKTLKTMATKYSRGPEFHFVTDFVLPWDEYFPNE